MGTDAQKPEELEIEETSSFFLAMPVSVSSQAVRKWSVADDSV